MKLIAFFGAAIVLCLSASAVKAQTNPDRANLKGAGPTRVLVEALRPEAEATGLTREQIQSEVELRLRKAGIQVLDDNDDNSLSPYLYINFSTIKSSVGGFFADSIEVK